jgi:hypothetical protein
MTNAKTKLIERLRLLSLFAVLGMGCSLVSAADIGQVKVVRGQVDVERNGRTMPAKVGMRLETADVVKTGADGAIGITMADNSLLSADRTASCRSIGSTTIRRRIRAASTRSCKRDRSPSSRVGWRSNRPTQ